MRYSLRYHGMVILIPRSPLVPGAVYTVELDVNGKRYAWTFRVAENVVH